VPESRPAARATLGSPGVGKDTYHITLVGGFAYDSTKQVLIGGNVQIHFQGRGGGGEK
jgi:hypothetical protein